MEKPCPIWAGFADVSRSSFAVQFTRTKHYEDEPEFSTARKVTGPIASASMRPRFGKKGALVLCCRRQRRTRPTPHRRGEPGLARHRDAIGAGNFRILFGNNYRRH